MNKKKANFKTNNQSISGNYILITSNAINKNNDIVYNAWPFVAKKLPNVILNIVGLKEKPTKLKNFKNVISYNNMSYDNVQNHLKKSDVLLFTSLSECLGLPLLEAKVQRVKIVAPDLDFVWEVIEPDFVYNHKNHLSLSRMMILSLGGYVHEKPNLMNAKTFLDLVENKEKIIFK